MSLVLYKSNKASKGSLFSIKFVAKSSKKDEDFKPGGFFINIVKQTGWNEQTNTGKFSGGDSVSFKLDQAEAAKIIHVIERNWNVGDLSEMTDRNALAKQYGFYNMHKSGSQTVHINFVPWQRKTDSEQSGFALHVTKVDGEQNTSFGAAFSYGEDIQLREYLKLGLEHINMAAYAEDKRRFEESVNNRNGNGSEGADSTPKSNKTISRGRPRAVKPAPAPVEAESEEASNEDEPLF